MPDPCSLDRLDFPSDKEKTSSIQPDPRGRVEAQPQLTLSPTRPHHVGRRCYGSVGCSTALHHLAEAAASTGCRRAGHFRLGRRRCHARFFAPSGLGAQGGSDFRGESQRSRTAYTSTLTHLYPLQLCQRVFRELLKEEGLDV